MKTPCVIVAAALLHASAALAADGQYTSPFPDPTPLTEKALERLEPTDSPDTVRQKFGWPPHSADIIPCMIYDDAEVKGGVIVLFFSGGRESHKIWIAVRAKALESALNEDGRIVWPSKWRGMTVDEMIAAEKKEPANKPVETTSLTRLEIRVSCSFAIALRSVSHG